MESNRDIEVEATPFVPTLQVRREISKIPSINDLGGIYSRCGNVFLL